MWTWVLELGGTNGQLLKSFAISSATQGGLHFSHHFSKTSVSSNSALGMVCSKFPHHMIAFLSSCVVRMMLVVICRLDRHFSRQIISAKGSCDNWSAVTCSFDRKEYCRQSLFMRAGGSRRLEPLELYRVRARHVWHHTCLWMVGLSTHSLSSIYPMHFLQCAVSNHFFGFFQ